VAEFKNPNQQGAPQDNRSLMILMVALLLGFSAFNIYRARHNPQTASPNAPAQISSQTSSPASAFSAAQPSPTVTQTIAGKQVQIPMTPAVVGAAEQTTVVENELYKITFSNKGGQAVSWILKQYKDSYGKPLDLVHTQAAEQFGYPLSLWTYDPGLTANLASMLYQPSATGSIGAPGTLTYRYVSGGFDVTKTFSFDDTYVVHAETQVLRNGAPVEALLAWPGGFGDQENLQSYATSQVDYAQDGKEKHESIKDVHGGNTLTGGFDWAGTSDLYFASIILPDHISDAVLATLHNEMMVPKANRKNGLGQGVAIKPNSNPAKDDIKVPVLGAAVGDRSGHNDVRMFVGPKRVEVLRNIHPTGLPQQNLEPLLDFGFFSIVGKPLFYALRWIHEHMTSGYMGWGWAIVLLTILINIVILPLRIKTMVAGLKMQRIQPQIEAIKSRYKNPKMNDPKFNEMNAEVMQYQKDQGVNMFGGCVPTLIQMPLLFAFFGMLPKVVELRQAHWFWLPDLAAADPYHILPIIMVVSQFLVQFYTPSPGVDPQQQKMMAFMMPAFSGYMTWNYASGLALYWSVGNVISIATQQVLNQTSLGKEMRELATKRARKKAGLGVGSGPKTIQGKAVRR
jgi:YidC/Oxa1 family membrane protein insertase